VNLTTNPLSIYLSDHLAGATFGTELARRARGENEGTVFGDFLAELADEIDEDRAELEAIMEALGVGRDRVKTTLAWAGEKAGRLKLNGRILGYSPLSRVLELEGLLAGVQGKLALWRALLELAPTDPRLDAPMLRRLASRAEKQLERLSHEHRRAVREALAGA
jgi:hypothetical protein